MAVTSEALQPPAARPSATSPAPLSSLTTQPLLRRIASLPTRGTALSISTIRRETIPLLTFLTLGGHLLLRTARIASPFLVWALQEIVSPRKATTGSETRALLRFLTLRSQAPRPLLHISELVTLLTLAVPLARRVHLPALLLELVPSQT
ncbi:hypothetical protein ARMGADRAFT_1077569 [Armillaria gallica]|uniref:Uncharacterized protein n=1 Tax=Armillaria gallica TaxID=47427 RepID=A0A2H3DYW4_ARMGA|nr:hypothetical protein ARMGADRAFT_1077569 [Armillaria gallica]